MAAAVVARDLAVALDGRLVLAHAAAAPLQFDAASLRRAELTQVARAGRALLAHVAADAEHRVMLADAALALDLVARDERPELLVVGAHGRSSQEPARLGRVTAHLIATAACPVVVVPPGAEGPVARSGSILCGDDRTPASRRALDVARSLADRMRLGLSSVLVAPPVGWVDAPPPSTELLHGDPVERLCQRARRDDVRMIVLGARAYGPWWRPRAGRVSSTVPLCAQVPAVVVPPTAMVSRVASFGVDRTRA
jgi:nucleotide-binding universal stress UspA family protein